MISDFQNVVPALVKIDHMEPTHMVLPGKCNKDTKRSEYSVAIPILFWKSGRKAGGDVL